MDWLVVFNVPSTARSFRDGTPHLLSLAKDVKLDKYTVPTGNWTPGRRMAVHYVTAALRKLRASYGSQLIFSFSSLKISFPVSPLNCILCNRIHQILTYSSYCLSKILETVNYLCIQCLKNMDQAWTKTWQNRSLIL